jgi:hypothetical protein
MIFKKIFTCSLLIEMFSMFRWDYVWQGCEVVSCCWTWGSPEAQHLPAAQGIRLDLRTTQTKENWLKSLMYGFLLYVS